MPILTKAVVALIVATLLPMAALAQTTPSTQSKGEVSSVGIMPSRGMTMEQVKQSFGEPVKIIAAVGQPPISRWIYDGFAVYFENDHVIHALVTDNGTK